MMADSYDWNNRHKKRQPPAAAEIIPYPTPATVNGNSPYGTKALQEEIYNLANTAEGARNDQLNIAAFSLAQLVASGHLEAVHTQQQLRATALTIGLTATETDATLRSAFQAGIKHPRQVPELTAQIQVVEVQYDPETGEAINPSQAADQTAIDRRQLQIEALYVTHEGLANIRPPEPIIEGWLYRNSLAWLAGKPGDGKSFIALDMAYSVATGNPWQGNSVTQGKVLYIAAEGASGLSIRANAWCQANGNPDHIPIVYLPLAVRLVNPAEIDVLALIQALQALQPGLVIIDTQARVTTGAEENSAKDMGWFIDALETLRRAHPATYLTVHHTPRNGDNLRGSIALEGAAETVLLSVKDGDIVTLKCQKQKNAPETEDLQMAMTPLGDSVILSSEAVELVGKMSKIMEQLLQALVEGLRREAGSTELREYVGLKNGGNFARPIQDLVNMGFVSVRQDGNRRFYQATAKGQLHLLRKAPQAPGATGDRSSVAPPPFTGGASGATPTQGAPEPKLTAAEMEEQNLCDLCLLPLNQPSDDPDCTDEHVKADN